nr:PREDICTED: peroxisomal acyl-coenzyme A oxidase 2 [Latimeria chalumnae]|eukprot:XP_014344984.1 PREDICTED: peroxisomal acyl-coenzyme A oxidase 2 [Latimeria chalumnae]
MQYAYGSLRALEDVAFGTHSSIFIPTIMNLGTDKQIAKWVPPARNYSIIGTYAQTELAHGTYLRGLETTATFDPSAQEFILNMLEISSMKWWPGDLGRSATHALVLAQLYTEEKCYGMHPFIVQIRSLHDHSPLPGVVVGDIGPKMGLEHVDNGYLLLRNVRIPRENMLSKYSEVSPDGTYVKRGSDRINYFSMIYLRTRIVSVMAATFLSKACVIAIRYSVVQRQSELKPGEPEPKILDYQTQEQKLLPQLATAYALHFVGLSLNAFFNQVYEEIGGKGNFSSLTELRALAAGTKALATDVSTAGVEAVRRACGGHGYSLLSGLPSIYSTLVASCSYEGENTVMLLQTARFLVKSLDRAHSGQSLPASVAYLSVQQSSGCSAKDKVDFLNPYIYIEAYKHRASRVITDAGTKLQSLIQTGIEQHVAWNNTSILLAQAAMKGSSFISGRL